MAKRKVKTLRVDFSGVESSQLIDEAKYLVKVLKVEIKESPNRDEPFLAWQFEIVDGHGFVGSHLFDNTSTTEKSLWRLRKRIEAMNFDIPDGPMEIDPLAFVDENLVVSVGHEEYQGRSYARVLDDFPVDTWEISEEDDEEDDDESEDDEEDTDEEVEEIEEEFDYSESDIMGMSKSDLDDIVDEYEELDDSLKATKAVGVKRKKVYKALKDAGYAS